MNFERIGWCMCVVAAIPCGMALEQARVHRQQQATVQTGVYTPLPPMPRYVIDCSPEGREICKVRSRMEKIKGKST